MASWSAALCLLLTASSWSAAADGTCAAAQIHYPHGQSALLPVRFIPTFSQMRRCIHRIFTQCFFFGRGYLFPKKAHLVLCARRRSDLFLLVSF